jgi:putative pyrroloquinoline-quinone binding quinoprotein
MTTRAKAACAAIAFAAASAMVPLAARGQGVDVERPRTLLVGHAACAAPVDRVDTARTGLARTFLPSTALHSPWRISLGMPVDHAPLIDARGQIYVVGNRGELVMVSPHGEERWRVSTAGVQAGPAALLSDDTVVFVDGAGEALGVREGILRFRTRIGSPSAARAAPLPLDDGGVVVAAGREFAALDSQGRERARIELPEASANPMIAAMGQVVIVTTSGAVWIWPPGAAEAIQVGTFGTPIDGGAGLADEHTLVAVTATHAHLCAIDLARGTTTVRARSAGDLWLGPPAMFGSTANLTGFSAAGEQRVSVDAAGVETHVSVVANTASAPDGGLDSWLPLARTPPLIDASGRMAFATLDGSVAVAEGSSAMGRVEVERLAHVCCPELTGAAKSECPIAGLAPLGPDAFVAVCRSGTLVAVEGYAQGGSATSVSGRAESRTGERCRGPL